MKTILTLRLMQLAALIAASVAMGRSPLATRADACATCLTADDCKGTPYGGTESCNFPPPLFNCKQGGGTCNNGS